MIVATQVKTTHWKHFPARAPEWLNAAILICWGSYVLMHPAMFLDDRTKAMFQGMIAFAPQPVWGYTALIVGLGRGTALYINGRSKRTPTIRLLASFFSAFILTQITMALFKGDGPNTGMAVYPWLVLADMYSAFRASADMTFVARQDDPVKPEPGRAVSFAKPS